MGKASGAQQRVTDYLLSLHLGVSTSVDALTGIYIDKKAIWEGTQSGQVVIPVNLPQLNGGPTAQGGVVGNVYYLPGGDDQLMPPELAVKFGRTPETCPGYRGQATLFFTGFQAQPVPSDDPFFDFSSLQRNYTGFTWSSNNPMIAQNISAKVLRAPKGLDQSIAIITDSVEVVTVTHTDENGVVSKNQYVSGTDPNSFPTYEGDTVTNSSMPVRSANPAHIIFETMTNAEWGMGCPTSAFDMASFNSAAQTLYDEGLGLSILWAKQSTIQDFVNEIINHIQGVVFLNPETGLWTLKLIRADYDVNSLPVFTPDNATMSNFSQKAWGETINEISVTWTNPLNEGEETVTVQDLANIAIQGAPNADSRNYYGVRTAKLATILAARDCRSSSAPLRSMEMAVDRSAWNQRPAGCVVVNWPENRIAGAVMRIGKIDYGKKTDPKIKVSLVEDVFSLDHPTITTGPTTGWVDPTEPPTPVDDAEIITLPAFFALTADLQSKQIQLDYPEVLAAAFAYKQSKEVNNYDLYTPQTNTAGSSDFRLAGTKTLIERSVLSEDLPAQALSDIPNSIVGNTDRGPIVGGFLFIGEHDSDFEICLVVDTTNPMIAVARGCLDTVPKAWAAGTRVWFVNVGERLVDDKIIRSAGEEVSYKFLTRTNKGTLPVGDAATFTQTLTARPHLPLRPANVKVNGTAFGSTPIGSHDTLAVTWATRNRSLEDGQPLRWTDGRVAPEYRQGTVVTVQDGSGTVVYQQYGLWTEDDLSMPAAWFARYSDIFITVSADRDGFASLQGHTIHVTGLPGNPAASPPPAPPALTEPPPPGAPPNPDNWDVFGTSITGTDGSAIPALQIAGTPDVASAEDLIIEYRIHGDEVWTAAPLVPLKNRYISTYVTGVLAVRPYDVRIAYQLSYGADGTLLSQWADLGTVTTGQGIASDAAALGARIAGEVLAQIDDAIAQGAELVTRLDEAIQDADAAAEAVLQGILNTIELGANVDKQTHIDGDSLVEIMSIIGIMAADKSAFIVDVDQVKYSDDGSTVADRFSALTAADLNNAANIFAESTARATADGAFTSIFALQGSVNGAHTAFVLNESTTEIGSRGSISTVLSGLTASDTSNSAAIASEITARANAITSEATARLALASTVGSNTSTISFVLSALGGNQAYATLALNVGGHVSGFTINGSTQQFAIVASQFAVVDPGGGGSPTTPIIYDSGTIYLNSAVVAQSIKANSITTDHLVDNSVTIPHNASIGSASPGTGSDQQLLAFTVDMVRAGYIKASCTLSLGFSAIPSSWNANLKIAGAIVGHAEGSVPGDSVALSGSYIGLSPGSYVVEVVVINASTITPGSCNLDGQGVYK